MWKYLLLMILFLVSCRDEKDYFEKNNYYKKYYNIIEIDSCEYIMYEQYVSSHFSKFAITHKGNCKNH